jgi:hypothetical protein
VIQIGPPVVTEIALSRALAGDPPASQLLLQPEKSEPRHPIEAALAGLPSGQSVACV